MIYLKPFEYVYSFFWTQGDVNYVTVVGKPIIVLNSYQAAKDLLEKRGGIYSSRPRMVMLGELYVASDIPCHTGSDPAFLNKLRMGWGEVLSHQAVGPRFRKHRRIIQEQFNPKKVSQYAHVLRMEAYATLADLGNTPDDLMKHLKRSVLVSFDSLGVPDWSRALQI